jgi:hypothetical protein
MKLTSIYMGMVVYSRQRVTAMQIKVNSYLDVKATLVQKQKQTRKLESKANSTLQCPWKLQLKNRYAK